MMVTRSHVSIGDVLNQLRDEFPDITISKIRFLESQGLVDPERTPSGYRKFYAADVERLRFVLRQQREHFLPLKVIKDRLDEADRDGTLLAAVDAASPMRDGAVDEMDTTDAEGPAPTTARRRGKRPAKEPVLFEETRKAREQAEAREVTAVVAEEGGPDDLAAPTSGVSLTRAELAKAAELSDEELGRLEEYALVAPSHTTGDRVLFNEDALAVARIALRFHAPRDRAPPPPHVPRVRRARGQLVRAGALAVPAPAQSRRAGPHRRGARGARGPRPAVAHGDAAPGRAAQPRRLTATFPCPLRSCSMPTRSPASSPGWVPRSKRTTPMVSS